MFKEFDPREGKRFQLLGEDGKLSSIAKKYPLPDETQLILGYKTMVTARAADEWAVSLNRQGRMPTYAPNKGQEANSVGSLLALESTDWFVPAFRELGGMLLRGLPLEQLYLYWLGDEMGSYLPQEKYHMLPISVPIASQCLHAAGVGYAMKYKKLNNIVISFVGDGGTSEGEFFEACNFAGVWKSPVIFFVQNNQWAISTPRKKQTASETIAEKAFAFGFDGIQVDGNDIFAVFAATKIAADRARNGEGPVLIEGFTYRLGAHTTADDPTRYRSGAEVEEWVAKDPLVRLRKYLLNSNILTQTEMDSQQKEAELLVQESFDKTEEQRVPTIEETFQSTYKEMPPLLKSQLERKKALRS